MCAATGNKLGAHYGRTDYVRADVTEDRLLVTNYFVNVGNVCRIIERDGGRWGNEWREHIYFHCGRLST